MNKNYLTRQHTDSFENYLRLEEKSHATIEKYMRDISKFQKYAQGKKVTKELTVEYKKHLQERGYAVSSINSMLAALNSFLQFFGWDACKVKTIRQQKKTYCAEEKELSREEYMRLLDAAEKQPKLRLVIQTICATGIRVSELKYFTVENIRHGEITIHCKSKTRTILVPRKLRTRLLEFSKKNMVRSGPIFVTRTGKPLNRSNIWLQMKKLCKKARINPAKVFPHNLRKLFARTFYKMEKDIAKLADILGHSSINTTRIYIMTTGIEHRRKIERLGLII